MSMTGDIDISTFTTLPELLARHAAQRPAALALRCGEEVLSYRELDEVVNRVAATLQARALGPGHVVAICAQSSCAYLALFLGGLRAGLAVAPLAPSSTAAQLAAMAQDAEARVVFIDTAMAARGVAWPSTCEVVAMPNSSLLEAALGHWLVAQGQRPAPVEVQPAWPFNIIYSSGTTGTPKGIVQPHAMRWAHIQRAVQSGYAADTVALIATPLYSNTTLVCVIPTLAHGGQVVLMPKFDAARYLQLAQEHRVTHTMLVPVQYQRLMAHADFDRYDLTSFRCKLCTSAPFHAELKAEVIKRWPGALVEYYGMTEGGGTCILYAHLHADKLHTVGQPAPGHDLRLIDEAGVELPRKPGGASVGSGEVVGRSPGMMTGYHHQAALTAAAEWYDAEGQRYLRTGDVARFDEDGFLVLQDRRKDMIISGGFNVYPSDLEAVLRGHPAVADVAVVGVPSVDWGETPVAYCVLQAGALATADALKAWANEQVGKTQRLHTVVLMPELPRSAIGKVLKRELRQAWLAGV